MSEAITTAVRPLRNLVYIEKIRRTRTGGGILLPLFGAFMGHSAKKKMAATPDYFPARVLATGPDVRELVPGDEVLVYTFAEGDGSKLYTGENVGERERMMVMYPNDILCAVENDPEEDDAPQERQEQEDHQQEHRDRDPSGEAQGSGGGNRVLEGGEGP